MRDRSLIFAATPPVVVADASRASTLKAPALGLTVAFGGRAVSRRSTVIACAHGYRAAVRSAHAGACAGRASAAGLAAEHEQCPSRRRCAGRCGDAGGPAKVPDLRRRVLQPAAAGPV